MFLKHMPGWKDEDLHAFLDDLFTFASKWEERLHSAVISHALLYQSIGMLAKQVGPQKTLETIMEVLEAQDICSITMVPVQRAEKQSVS